jgi:hypothetical protein
VFNAKEDKYLLKAKVVEKADKKNQRRIEKLSSHLNVKETPHATLIFMNSFVILYLQKILLKNL